MNKDEALDLALEALERLHYEQYTHQGEKAITAIKQALAAPVQEPVGLIDRLTNPEQHYEFTDPKKANAVLMSLCQEAADALAAPVPPAWFPAVENILNEYGLQAIDFVADFKAAMKDAEQSQRTWVRLTDEEIEKLRESFATRYAIEAIEAKLKEKNT